MNKNRLIFTFVALLFSSISVNGAPQAFAPSSTVSRYINTLSSSVSNVWGSLKADVKMLNNGIVPSGMPYATEVAISTIIAVLLGFKYELNLNNLPKIVAGSLLAGLLSALAGYYLDAHTPEDTIKKSRDLMLSIDKVVLEYEGYLATEPSIENIAKMTKKIKSLLYKANIVQKKCITALKYVPTESLLHFALKESVKALEQRKETVCDYLERFKVSPL